VNCGHFFLLFSVLQFLPVFILYRRLQSNFPEVIRDLKWNKFFDAANFTAQLTLFLFWGHWKLRDKLLSLMCVASSVHIVLAILSFFHVSWICSGGFKIG
jgi:hypothetical protein